MKKLASVLLAATFAATVIGCGGPKYINDLPLVWASGDATPKPTTAVDQALAATPLKIGEFKDGRSGDKATVGTYKEEGFAVKTKGDVRAFWAGRLRIMLEGGGAKLSGTEGPRFDAELVQFDCIEDNLYEATASFRVTITRPGAEPWSKLYEGKAKQWGRSHSSDNFTEVLSRALSDGGRKMLQDEAFAKAILGQPQTAAATPAPEVAPATPAPSAAPAPKAGGK